MLFYLVTALVFFLSGCGEEESEFPSREPILIRSNKPASKALENDVPTVPTDFSVTWDWLENAEKELERLSQSLERALRYSATASDAAIRENSARLIRADILAVTKALEDIASQGVTSEYVRIKGEYKVLIEGIPDIEKKIRKLESVYYNPYRSRGYYP